MRSKVQKTINRTATAPRSRPLMKVKAPSVRRVTRKSWPRQPRAGRGPFKPPKQARMFQESLTCSQAASNVFRLLFLVSAVSFDSDLFRISDSRRASRLPQRVGFPAPPLHRRLPTFPVFVPDKLVGFLHIGHLQLFRVPMDRLARAQRHVAQ